MEAENGRPCFCDGDSDCGQVEQRQYSLSDAGTVVCKFSRFLLSNRSQTPRRVPGWATPPRGQSDKEGRYFQDSHQETRLCRFRVAISGRFRGELPEAVRGDTFRTKKDGACRSINHINPIHSLSRDLKCSRCGYEWKPRTKNPKECPECKARLGRGKVA